MSRRNAKPAGPIISLSQQDHIVLEPAGPKIGFEPARAKTGLEPAEFVTGYRHVFTGMGYKVHVLDHHTVFGKSDWRSFHRQSD